MVDERQTPIPVVDQKTPNTLLLGLDTIVDGGMLVIGRRHRVGNVGMVQLGAAGERIEAVERRWPMVQFERGTAMTRSEKEHKVATGKDHFTYFRVF